MREDGGYAIADKVPLGKTLLYSLQHLMAFVGGGAIVPAMIMGLDPALAVFCTGIGTIIYLICTRNRVPSYFGVSFSFITPMAVVMGDRWRRWRLVRHHCGRFGNGCRRRGS